MTEEKMIPLSVIDALIKDFKTVAKHDPPEESAQQYLINIIIPTLENLKKEAVPVPDYEQRIRDRIKELEEKCGTVGFPSGRIYSQIDELRKLLK